MLDEFCRVLVRGGVAFISSPNKLVYSDIPNFANEHHVRELYFDEFRELVTRRFANVAFYGQRLVTISALHRLDPGQSESSGWFGGNLNDLGEGMPILPAPMYFLAVCSDAPLPRNIASGYIDPQNTL